MMPPSTKPGPARAARWMRAVCLAALCLAAGCKTSRPGTFASSRADTLLAAHTQAFYQVQDDRAWFKETTAGGKVSFWMRAEEMEMELDAYERTANPRQLDMFTKLFHGFVADHGADWTHNEYNDDIMWIVIACTRGYLLSGNTAFRRRRSRQFRCLLRPRPGPPTWAAASGGGRTKTKNACVNGPAAIAAALLGRALHDPAYLCQGNRSFSLGTGHSF